MRSLWRQTSREKAGSVDGLSLFFGALLGANLGTVEALDTKSYVALILLLAGTVVTIQMAVRSERRTYALGSLTLYAALILWMIVGDSTLLREVPAGTREKLGITLMIWTGSVMLFALWPTMDSVTTVPADPDDQAVTGFAPRTGRAEGSSAS